MFVRDEYRQLEKSNVWHFHPECQHYRQMDEDWSVKTRRYVVREQEPTTGELCNECLAKERRQLA